MNLYVAPDEVGAAIAEYLHAHPGIQVRTQLYI